MDKILVFIFDGMTDYEITFITHIFQEKILLMIELSKIRIL
ncbi:hypothetical protein [Clostridium sp.]|nr:hypothetical protein [Clostridium sp.]